MTFQITNITRCSGGGHYHFTVVVGEETHTLTYYKDDFDLEPDELEVAFLSRIRSAMKEAGAVTVAERRAALLNKEFKI